LNLNISVEKTDIDILYDAFSLLIIFSSTRIYQLLFKKLKILISFPYFYIAKGA